MRGGSTDSLEDAQLRLEEHKPDEGARVRAVILHLGLHGGEIHGDKLSELELSEPNMIGAQINGLAKRGLIEPTGEWRKAVAPAAHGRTSRVWRLTPAGFEEATARRRLDAELDAQIHGTTFRDERGRRIDPERVRPG